MRLLPVLLCLLLTACASGSALVIGKVRPATTPETVRIYVDAPKQYERIAIINTEGRGGFTMQDNQDLALKEIKAKAAEVGANGVLLTSTGDQSSPYVMTTATGGFITGNSRRSVITGEAIWVNQ